MTESSLAFCGQVLFEIFKYLHFKHLLTRICLVNQMWRNVVFECCSNVDFVVPNDMHLSKKRITYNTNKYGHKNDLDMKCKRYKQLLQVTQKFKNLRSLYVQNLDGAFRISSLFEICSCSQLREITLVKCGMTPELIQVETPKTLYTRIFGSKPGSVLMRSYYEFPQIPTTPSTLSSLTLADHFLTSEDLVIVLNYLQNLTTLRLFQSHKINLVEVSSRIEHLVIDNTGFSNIKCEFASDGIKQLRSLALRNASVPQSVHEALSQSNAPHLRYLELGWKSAIEAQTPSELSEKFVCAATCLKAELSSLDRIAIHNDIVLTLNTYFKHLTSLTVSGSTLTSGTCLQLPKLEHLELNTVHPYQTPIHAETLFNLRYLKATRDSIEEILSLCEKLEAVDLSRLKFSSACSVLSHCTQLKTINCAFAKSENYAPLNFTSVFERNDFCRLTKLDLSYTTADDQTVLHLNKNAPNLTYLSLKTCVSIVDPQIQLPSLRYLGLSGTKVSASRLEDIVARCTNIRKLEVTSCSSIKGARLTSNTISHIDLSENDFINSTSLTEMIQGLTVLSSLMIRWCVIELEISLFDVFKELAVLDMTSCKVSENTQKLVSKLKRYNKDLEIKGPNDTIELFSTSNMFVDSLRSSSTTASL